jgi:small-conductance mechanosensitive channel/CRP-like cAMP-binding protein
MDVIFRAPLHEDVLVLDGVGVLLAATLIAGLGATLMPSARHIRRTPTLLLVAHVVVFALAQAVPEALGLGRLLTPLALMLLLLSIGRSGVLLVLDVLVVRRLGRDIPRIIRDILQGLVYAGIGLAVLHSAGVEPGSLLTTSALLTAVLGLSLQDTLGNVFSGLAIQMQRPFDVGDWIQFDGEPKNIGRVVEINWRATKVITLDDVEVTVPNGSLAKAPIRNFTKPTAASRRSIYFQAPYDVPPDEIHRAVIAAISDAPGVVGEPPPSIVTHQFTESGIEYWVRFFTDQFHRRDGIDGGVRDRIWHALRRLGVDFPFPSRAIHLQASTEERRARSAENDVEKRSRALRHVDFFRVLSDGEHRRLAETTISRRYAAGEIIVRQGDESSELYVIERGEVVISLERAGEEREVEVARLGAGKLFGEMALITGDKRHATVRAATPCELVEVGREAMQHILARSPDLAERISAVLAERKAELDLHASLTPLAKEQEVEERKSELLGRIKKLFAL